MLRLLLLVLPLMIGCAALSPAGQNPSPSAAWEPAGGGGLTVFAAGSLQRALEEVETTYEAANPGIALTVSTDSSSALATQIEQGAPADVFLSADTANAQRLAGAGLAAGEPVVFAANELAIVVPADNPAAITSPADLADEGVDVIAAGAEVPITRYATRLVENLAEEPGYPAGFVAAYERNVVSREDNVNAVVAKVELGQGDAAIVYATDAAAARDVVTIEVPERANVRARYAGVVAGASPRRDVARAFLDWLAGGGGRPILERFGFLPPAP